METMLDDNSTDSWGATLNLTEPEDELTTLNATVRIVGGDLEKRGGSPWQVRRPSLL